MGDTLRTFLKVQNLYVRDINREASYALVMAYLEKLGGPNCKVVLPADHNNPGKHIGQAYLNFSTHEESKTCLDKYRFSIKFKEQPAKLMYAAVDKYRVYGPYSSKFQVIVKNLSEEVDVEMLFEFFSRFGEIYQCKTDTNMYKQYYGQITYLDEESVAEAVTGANQTRWHSSVIMVEPHYKAHTVAAAAAAAPAAPPPPPPPAAAAAARSVTPDQPTTAAASTPPPPPAAAASSSSSSVGGLRVIQLPKPQQQQQPGTPASVGSSSSSSQQQHSHQPTLASFFQQQLQQQQQRQQQNLLFSPPVADIPLAAPVPITAVDNAAAATGADPVRLNLDGLNLGLSIARPTAAAAAAANGNDHVRMMPPGYLHHLRDIQMYGGAAAAASSSDPGAVIAKHTAAAAAAAGSSRSSGGILKRLMNSVSEISELLSCPITHDLFIDPVVAADGITYERAAIIHWLSNHDTSPMTNEVLPNMTLHPNKLVKTLIEELL